MYSSEINLNFAIVSYEFSHVLTMLWSKNLFDLDIRVPLNNHFYKNIHMLIYLNKYKKSVCCISA